MPGGSFFVFNQHYDRPPAERSQILRQLSLLPESIIDIPANRLYISVKQFCHLVK